MQSLVAFAAVAALLCAGSPPECTVDDIGQCNAQVPPAAGDHVLLQTGANHPKGAAHGAARHRAHLKAKKTQPRRVEDCTETTCKIPVKRTAAPEEVALTSVGSKEEAGAEWSTQDFDRRDFIKMRVPSIDEEKTIETLMAKAAGLLNKDEDIATGDHEKNNVDREVKDMQTDNFYSVPADKDVQVSAKVLKEAAEIVAEANDVSEATQDGIEITSDLLMRLDGLTETPERSGNVGAFEGDMIAGNPRGISLMQEAERTGTRWAGKLWPSSPPAADGTTSTNIFFCFAGDIHPRIQRVFLEAVAQYERLIPCLKFTQVKKKNGRGTDPEGEKECESGESKAIFVQSKFDGNCNSQVGVMEEPVTRLQLDPLACDSIGEAVHQIGHAIGMGHETARVDRDNYVQVQWQNVQPGKASIFDKDEMEGGMAAPYDPNSIMSFGGNFFSKNGKDTLKLIGSEAVGSKTVTHLGNRMSLSQADVKQVATMYGCGKFAASFATCTSEPGSCTPGDCVCHNEGKSMIKVTDESGQCHSCKEQCPADGSICSKSADCGCAPGFKKESFQTDSGTACYACALPQPTGTLTEIEMTRPMEVLLGSGMPFKDMIAGIKRAFAKRPPDEVTVERGEGTIKVTIKSKRTTPEGIRTSTSTQEGTWR